MTKVNANLKQQLKSLLRNATGQTRESREVVAVRTWFSYWDNHTQLAQKVLLWGRVFLPHYFKDKDPDFHMDLIMKFFSDEFEYTAAPRGFAKTTINQLCIMFACVNQLDRYIVLVEKSFGEAAEVIDAIRDEFKNNSKIIGVYGPLLQKDVSGQTKSTARDAQGDIFVNGVRVRAKGFDTPIRGLKSGEWRPTKIIVDDVESDQHINSSEQRLKYKENMRKGIMPALDVRGTLKVVGTILHKDSLLMRLITDHDGTVYRAHDLHDDTKNLLWPDRWSTERLRKQKERMGTSAYTQEYLNEPVDDESRVFKYDWLGVAWDELPSDLTVYSTIDVADSKVDTSDYTGIITVGVDADNTWYILRCERAKLNSTELLEKLFEIWTMDKPQRIGVEKSSFEDQVEPYLKQLSEERKIWPAVVQLKHGGRRKEDRIRGALEWRFERGSILFPPKYDNDYEALIGELYDFPAAEYDDLADALAYIDQFVLVEVEEEIIEKPQKSHDNLDYYFERATKGDVEGGVVEFEDIDNW